MTDLVVEQIVLASRPRGEPKLENFRLETVEPEPLRPGGVALRVLYLSLDPYMRGRMDDRKSYAPAVAVGQVMVGQSVAEVTASDNPLYKPGDIVLAPTGWRTHFMSDGAQLRKIDPKVAPVTAFLGVLGMPGFTAYAGLTLIGKPKPGETVVVAAASGPVGSLVGQLAKMAGARAVGIAGGEAKCRYLMELGFDAAVNHRADDLERQLAAACPEGIDIYFENVGGRIWQAVLPLMNRFGRVPISGLIAQYNAAGPAAGADLLPETMRAILSKSLTLRGFINYEFVDEHYAAFLLSVGHGLSADRIRYREDVAEGIRSAPEAFFGMLQGRNFGKVLVKIA